MIYNDGECKYLDGEVHNRGGRETTNTNTRDVLGDSGVLESSRVGTTGGSVDLSSQGTSAVLVDLVESHGDGAVVGSGRETRRSTLTSSSGDTLLSSTLGGLGSGSSSASGTASASSCTGESIEKTTLVVGSGGFGSGGCATGSSVTHEVRDGSCRVDGTATLGAAESRGLATHLLSTDDGCVGLRA